MEKKKKNSLRNSDFLSSDDCRKNVGILRKNSLPLLLKSRNFYLFLTLWTCSSLGEEFCPFFQQSDSNLGIFAFPQDS